MVVQTPLLHPLLRYGLGSGERNDRGEYFDGKITIVA